MAGSTGGRKRAALAVADDEVAKAGVVDALPGAVAAAKAAQAEENVEALSSQNRKRKAAAGPQVYVVQVRGAWCADTDAYETGVGFVAHPDGALWEDVATVTVPARSKRKTIIERALNTAEGKQLSLPVTLRILDAGAAREFPVGLRPRDPELVIG